MKEHNIKGQNRTGLPYKKEVKKTNKWNKDMDLIQNNYSNDKTQPVWSMDIKYIHTKECYLYINAIRDFYLQAIIWFWMLNKMSYEKIVLPSLNTAVDLYKKLDISIENLIVHTDNGKKYYAKEYFEFLEGYSMKPSKKQPNKFGGNALSENWFYHLTVEWIRGQIYPTLKDAEQDVIE